MSVSTDEAAEPGAYLRVGDEAFRCLPRVPFWLVAKVSHLERKGVSDAEIVPVIYQLVMGMIDPDDRRRADAALSEMPDLTANDLTAAIRDAMAEMSSLPFLSSSPSSDGATSPATPTSSRVVSFSRGTVEEVPLGDPDSSMGAVSSTG